MTDTTLRMRILREVALQADRFYDQAQALGHKAATNLTDKKRSQISGLENIANCALKTTDVFDYIKLRTARQKEWQSWGPELLTYLGRDLRTQSESITATLEIDRDSAEGLEVYLLLIREFVRQLAAQYEYACKFPEAT